MQMEAIYVLLARDPGQLWHAEYEDYDREAVKEEARAFRDTGAYMEQNLRVIEVRPPTLQALSEALQWANPN